MTIYRSGKSPVTITNIIANGSFENDWTNWVVAGDATKANIVSGDSVTGSKSAKSTGNLTAQETIVWYAPVITGWVNLVISGHKYYASYYGKNLSNISMQSHLMLNEVLGHPVLPANTPNWTKFSQVTVAGSVANTYFATLWGAGGGNGQPYYADGFILIDLTTSFGAGNEPSKEWCDANIGYFEGTRQIMNPNSSSLVNYEVVQQFRGLSGVNREVKEEYRSLSGVNRKVF